MAHPPAGCWACGAVPSEEDIRSEAILHPREAAEGGPYTRMTCRDCGAEGILEEAPGEASVLAPPEAAGIEVPLFATLLEGARARAARRRAREWMDRWGVALEILRATRGRASREGAGPPPRPAGGNRARGARDPGPPPPEPSRRPSRPAPADLPRTPGEARAVLGLDARATRKEIDAAFRRAARKCHPDLVAHLDEDFQRLAHDKFLRLKRAQEILAR